MRGPESARHLGGDGAGVGREGAKGVVSGAGRVAGVPGGEQDVVVAGGGDCGGDGWRVNHRSYGSHQIMHPTACY
jgi:hypothetical protein